MLHHKKTRKFGRESGQRTALIRGLAYSLVKHGKIETSLAKAKELRPFIEKLVTGSMKKGAMEAMRFTQSKLPSREIAGMLFKTIAPKYKDRKGGYTRIVKLPVRKSDGSARAIIEFV